MSPFFTEFLLASTFLSWRADALSAKSAMSKLGNPLSLHTIVRVFVKSTDDFVFLTSPFLCVTLCVTSVTICVNSAMLLSEVPHGSRVFVHCSIIEPITGVSGCGAFSLYKHV